VHIPRTAEIKPIYRASDIRSIETAAGPIAGLMERAGLAAAELARTLLGENGSSILVFAGPGNNGGDAFVAARHLRKWWYRVTVVFAGDADRLPADAREAWAKLRAEGGETIHAVPPAGSWDLIVDGLFGIGLTRDLIAPYFELVERINSLRSPVLSLDVPSGIDADTGVIRGVAVRAGHTLTFFGLKPGLLTGEGVDYAGEAHVATLGLDSTALPEAAGRCLDRTAVTGLLTPRAKNSHKGLYGSLGILGGAEGMVGAAFLAARAALYGGSGRIYLGLLAGDQTGIDLLHPELMFRAPQELLAMDHVTCLVVGPGLGQSAPAARVVDRALGTKLPLVLDADALNLISGDSGLQQLLRAREAAAIITPHPAEAARLLGSNVAAVQRDRVHAACELAQRLHSFVVLKGAGSVCAAPHGGWFINTSGNPGLSVAGMGDVLAGLIGALLAQGLGAEQALLLGVHVHGAAADALLERGVGPIGLTATEVTKEARTLLNRWTYGSAAG
jgi:ADP-dependent NAD(P)H-hydrate dehydratase / NAD(P)H-hydrate epimerase